MLKPANMPPESSAAEGPERAAMMAPEEKPATMAFFMSFFPRTVSSVHSIVVIMRDISANARPCDTPRFLLCRGKAVLVGD